MTGHKKIIVVGGGLAGLTSAILLQRRGFDVTVFEKKEYPFHRVCGEYISNEALPFLRSLNIPILETGPSQITRLSVTTESGKELYTDLPMGGFGLSRYSLDELLFRQAKKLGVTFLFEKVTDIEFGDGSFYVTSATGTCNALLAIAAYGKRSNLDQKLKRSFFYHRSPYMAVKYHIRTDLPDDLIRLDNFRGGYSGVCKIEDEKFNLCYLSETANLKKYHGISEMEENVLCRNPFLKDLFRNSEFVFAKPEVINEISFVNKTLTESHLLFCGDSAGMITPLCGNGMAMAFHSAKMLAQCIVNNVTSNNINRPALENSYTSLWTKEFGFRLKSGRMIQRLFGNPVLSDLAVSTLNMSPVVMRTIVKKTHGEVF